MSPSWSVRHGLEYTCTFHMYRKLPSLFTRTSLLILSIDHFKCVSRRHLRGNPPSAAPEWQGSAASWRASLRCIRWGSRTFWEGAPVERFRLSWRSCAVFWWLFPRRTDCAKWPTRIFWWTHRPWPSRPLSILRGLWLEIRRKSDRVGESDGTFERLTSVPRIPRLPVRNIVRGIGHFVSQRPVSFHSYFISAGLYFEADRWRVKLPHSRQRRRGIVNILNLVSRLAIKLW